VNVFHLGLMVVSLGLFESDQLPEVTHHVSQVDVPAVVASHNQFAWEAYARLSERPENIGFSPFSLASGLAMVQAGARGQTADQIASVLHLPAAGASAQRALGLLLRGLLSIDAGPRGVKLTSASSLWADKGLGLVPEFVALIHRQFETTVNEATFADSPESARRAINSWVKSQTDGKIPEFLKPGAVSETTELVLANALTFQGRWAAPFNIERTQPGKFRVSSTRQVRVPMMQQSAKFRLAVTPAGEALELPHTGHDVALVLLLPRQPDGLPELEKACTGPKLTEWLSQLKPETVDVTLPRFTTTSESQLKDLLVQLGMPLAFQREGADFSGICTSERSFALSSVVQHVRISVDETGTEAHAATAIRTNRGLGTPATYEFRADHPFVFFLRDMRTGTILFMGRLVEPEALARNDR
jgi:serpin B